MHRGETLNKLFTLLDWESDIIIWKNKVRKSFYLIPEEGGNIRVKF